MLDMKVISNSSFAWWAAALTPESPRKMIISPKKWLSEKVSPSQRANYEKGIFLEGWQRS